MSKGIYTLANDVVYDQLVALLNSIEANIGSNIPVCIIPYNDKLDKVRGEIATRDNVTLFEDAASIAYWENFVDQAWSAHREFQKFWQEQGGLPTDWLARHRRLCGFDGPFDKFIYFDADTLAMRPLDDFYQKLDEYDWVTNDFQYKSKLDYIFNSQNENLLKIFNADKLKSHIFCSGWFASKKSVFPSDHVRNILEKLKAGEADIISLLSFDQPLLNYMVLRSEIPYYNFAYHELEQATGTHCSSKFDVEDYILFDKGRPLPYLHYLGVSSSKFTQLCAGKDIDIPYRDVFLHYRYLKSPEERPKRLVGPNWFVRAKMATNSFIKKISPN